MPFVLFYFFINYDPSLKALLCSILKGAGFGYACDDIYSVQVLYGTLFVILAHIIMKYVTFN